MENGRCMASLPMATVVQGRIDPVSLKCMVVVFQYLPIILIQMLIISSINYFSRGLHENEELFGLGVREDGSGELIYVSG